eukprot:EG_transcript_8858
MEASAARCCTCCGQCFSPFRWEYTCGGCQNGVCNACSRRLCRGIGGPKVTYLCHTCIRLGVLIQSECVQRAAGMAVVLEQHRREKSRLLHEYDSLEAFTVQLQCALRRKSEALDELLDLSMATPQFGAGNSMRAATVANTPMRRVELHLPLCQVMEAERLEDEEVAETTGMAIRSSRSSRRSLGGQSNTSRRSGDNWEELDDWEDQNDRIQDLQAQLESLKRNAADWRHKHEQAELALRTLRQEQQRDFERFVKVDMQCMKYETQLLEEQEVSSRLHGEVGELQRENAELTARLDSMKGMFEAALEEAHGRVRELEQGRHSWFGGSPKPVQRHAACPASPARAKP